VIEIARINGLAIVLWSIYPETPGGPQDATAIADRVVSTARDGDIVFLHDTSMRAVEATQAIIKKLSAEGFEFVSVPEIIRRRLQLVAGRTYRQARDRDK
jgi:peptidoglycan/xylan/chitin deacetylase (PgdA/CDA1 family)